ncbi:hypothetical protein [Streptomyces sp. NPDC057494]|uniref:hypothetical protein n=1 Tax=Streptomyces sp. NPDC057494 TaxID=3346148 RepID=UPI0036846333
MVGAGSRTLVVMLTVACALSLAVAFSLFALAPHDERVESSVPPAPVTSEAPTPESTASAAEDLYLASPPADATERATPAPSATTTGPTESQEPAAASDTPDPFTESTSQQETTSGTDLALVAAACVSALGGACSGVAAIMVARRRPPSDE